MFILLLDVMENRAMGNGVVFFLRGGRLNWNRPRPFVVRPSFCRIPRLIQLKETDIARLGVFFLLRVSSFIFQVFADRIGLFIRFFFSTFSSLVCLFPISSLRIR